MPSKKQRRERPALRGAGLGIELLGAILGFTVLGFWIDKHFDTAPWGLLICIVVGFVGGFYNLIRTSLRELDPNRSKTKTSDSVDE